MKKLSYYLLAFLTFSITACDKSDDGDLVEPTATGTLNGSALDFNVILSDVVKNNAVETAYVVMRKDFEGFNKPATNGKQLLIRIEPYNGPGTYAVNANSFWVYEEEISISGNNFSSILHRFSSDEKEGSMKITITEDAVKQGKRTLIGSFEGKNGITEKSTFNGAQAQPLKVIEFKSVTFVAPAGTL